MRKKKKKKREKERQISPKTPDSPVNEGVKHMKLHIHNFNISKPPEKHKDKDGNFDFNFDHDEDGFSENFLSEQIYNKKHKTKKVMDQEDRKTIEVDFCNPNSIEHMMEFFYVSDFERNTFHSHANSFTKKKNFDKNQYGYEKIRERQNCEYSKKLVGEADMLYKNERFKKAAGVYTKALTFWKDNQKALLNRSRCYIHDKDWESAYDDVDHVLDINPNNKDARKLMKLVGEKCKYKKKKKKSNPFDGNFVLDERDDKKKIKKEKVKLKKKESSVNLKIDTKNLRKRKSSPVKKKSSPKRKSSPRRRKSSPRSKKISPVKKRKSSPGKRKSSPGRNLTRKKSKRKKREKSPRYVNIRVRRKDGSRESRYSVSPVKVIEIIDPSRQPLPPPPPRYVEERKILRESEYVIKQPVVTVREPAPTERIFFGDGRERIIEAPPSIGPHFEEIPNRFLPAPPPPQRREEFVEVRRIPLPPRYEDHPRPLESHARDIHVRRGYVEENRLDRRERREFERPRIEDRREFERPRVDERDLYAPRRYRNEREYLANLTEKVDRGRERGRGYETFRHEKRYKKKRGRNGLFDDGYRRKRRKYT